MTQYCMAFNILLVEDNPGDRDLIIEQLEQSNRSFKIETTVCLADALLTINKDDFNIVLLDLGLPDSTGLDTLIQFKSHVQNIPIIVLTGLDDEIAGIEAIRKGAEDYLVKGQVTANLLVRSFLHAIERHLLKERVDHYNSVLRAIRDINQLIVRESDPCQLILKACKVLVDTRGYRGVWAALGGCIGPASFFTHAGFYDGYQFLENNIIQGIWPACVGKALGSNERIVILNRCGNDSCPFQTNCSKNFVGVSLLKSVDKIYGVFLVFFSNSLEIDTEEKRLLHEISDDLSFSFHAIETKRQHRDAEEHIQQQHLFLQLLMDAIPISVFYKDTRGVLIGCNDAFAEFLSRTKEEITGKWANDIFSEEMGEWYTKFDSNLLKIPGIQQYESKIRKVDGSRRDVLINKASYFDAEGGVGGIIGAMLDISDRKVMEKRLLQSQKMESIGTLAGGIAHDFNNILSAIIGYTELSFDVVEKGSEVDNNLKEIYTASNRAKELVQRILAFARISDEEIRPIQPQLIIKEVLKLIRSSIPATIDIKQDLNSNSYIMGSATQIHQVMLNLCTNAAQSMEEKGGCLAINLEDAFIAPGAHMDFVDITPGDYIRIMVKDTGTGISPEIIGSIFEPYFTTKKPGEGTGMGLALVHGIVHSYGGRIFVDSTTGKGTAFNIYLPICRMTEGENSCNLEVLPRGSERILVVDDEPSVAKINCKLLEKLGYSVTISGGGIEALEMFQLDPGAFDLVISDMTMPKMTGDILAIELIKIRPDIPVILCTGYSKKISENLEKQLWIKGFLSKPVVKADMAKTVRKVLDKAKMVTHAHKAFQLP